MLIYLLKSGACLAIFMAFHTFFLEKENMHVFKRYYLLGALIIAFGIPLVTFTHYIEVAPVPTVNESVESMVYYAENIPQTPETNYLPIILWPIYWVGVLVFGAKFLMSLIQIIFKIRSNPKQKSKHIVHVLLSDLITPHTFFKYIFLNKQKFEQHEIPQEVFWHEETHAKQKHSIDVLFIELIQVIFWFNPLIYFAKQSIKMNHEFLADQAVLNRGISASNYQHILLAFSSDAAESPLANAINYSSTRHAIGVIKKRFTVMKTQTSKRNIWLRSALLLPLLAMTLYGFSEKKEIVKEITFQKMEPNQESKNHDASEEMMNEYRSFISNLDLKHQAIKLNEYNRIGAIYDLMSQGQKDSVEPFPIFPTVDFSKTTAKKPTQQQFLSWKNSSEFHIRIDGKQVNQSELNNYFVDDIYHYHEVLSVDKNGQVSPESNTFWLFTKKGWEEKFEKFKINEYNQLLNTYSNSIKAYLKAKGEDNSELRIKKSQLDKDYDEFTIEDKIKYNLVKAPSAPKAKNVNSNSQSNLILNQSNRKILRQEDPIKQDLSYKVLLNAKGHYLINDELGTLKTIEKDFKAISADKSKFKKVTFKYDVEAPKATIDQIIDLLKKYQIENDVSTSSDKLSYMKDPQKEATANEIAEYNKLARHYNSQSSDKIVIKLKDMGRLRELHNKMTSKQRANAEHMPNFPPPPPPTTKDGPRNATLVNQTISPPPPPMSPNASEKQRKAYEKAMEDHRVQREAYTYKHTNDKGNVVDVIIIPENDGFLPPPPPPPISPLEHVKEMSKKGAIFYYNNKTISADKAIKYIKNNKELSISTKQWDTDQPKVYISSKAHGSDN